MAWYQPVLDYFKKEQAEVYCQGCGDDVTSVGGNVTNDGKIYCGELTLADGPASELSCSDTVAMLQNQGRFLSMHQYTPKQVQKGIRSGDITEFGPLEQKTLNPNS